MSIDRFISNRLNESASRKPPISAKKERTLKSRLFAAAKTIEKFILFSHIKEGRIGSATLAASSLIFSDLITRKSKKRPKRQSVLARRRDTPRKTIIQPRTITKRRKPRSRSIPRSQSRSRLTV